MYYFFTINVGRQSYNSVCIKIGAGSKLERVLGQFFCKKIREAMKPLAVGV
jgi:hypothetical protein